MKIKTKQLTQMAVLAAMSILLVYLIHFPIFPAAPFLEYDPADIPIFIGTFMFGPLGGLILTAVVCVLQGVTVSSASGIIGILMHFFATGSFVLVAGNIYKRNRTRKGAVIGLALGSVTMTITMALWNIAITPFFLGIPVQKQVDRRDESAYTNEVASSEAADTQLNKRNELKRISKNSLTIMRNDDIIGKLLK